MPPYVSASRPPGVLVHATKPQRRVIRKIIQVASLSSRDPDKPCSSKSARMAHTIVTQIIITLDPSNGECNVTTATEKARKQLGFSVILLDSTLFPITESESTSSSEFWKSTRKIIAVSMSAYEKAGGVLPENELVDLDTDEPQTKRAKTEQESQELTSEVLKKLELIDKKLSFVTELQRTFECVICRSSVTRPVVAACCQRIIGCKECVGKWLVSNSRCPLCSVVGRVAEAIDLVGIFRVPSVPRSVPPDRVDEETISRDSADDFELPNVSVRHAN